MHGQPVAWLMAPLLVACQAASVPPALAPAASPSAASPSAASPSAASPSAAPASVASAPAVAATAQAAGRVPLVTVASPHTVLRVKAEPGVELEVLDWGGTGPLLLFLAGMGNTAHIFDDFAPAFVDRWHVVGLTRRGFGASTPVSGGAVSYAVPTLGQDVLRLLDHLGALRALLAGHSFAGEELTWLALEHPERVSALIYLDAAYDRAAHGAAFARSSRPEPPVTPADLESPRAYAAHLSRMMEMPVPLDEVSATFQFDGRGHFLGPAPKSGVIQQILKSIVSPDYARIQAPTLALYANADYWPAESAAVYAQERRHLAQALPSARVITIDHAPHYLFLTHQAAVVRQMREFLGALGG